MDEKKRFEDYVLIALIALGLFVGAFLYFLPDGQPISSIFVTFGLSCLLYRFLGGIGQNTKFSVGAFRLGGSAAFMIGCIYFINEYIYPKPEENSIVLSAPVDRWVPVKYATGEFEEVVIKTSIGDTIFHGLVGKDKESFKKREYRIFKEGEHYYLSSYVDSLIIGHIKFENLFKAIENDINITIKDFRVFKLYPYPPEFTRGKPGNKGKKYKSTINLAAVNNTFPLILEVDKINLNIKNRDDRLIISDVPRGEKFYLINEDGNYFIVIVLHANFETLEHMWYTELLIGKVSINR